MLTIKAIIGNLKKGQSALKVRGILADLEQSYQSVKERIKVTGCKAEKIKCTVYLTYPSQSNVKINYDVVFEFHTEDKLTLDTPFKVYSNSPSFGYTFAYVFFRLGSLLWPEKYPPEFRKIPPNTRNPFYFIGFDKGIFSTIRYVSDYSLERIVSELNGTVPSVKTFSEKQQEVNGSREVAAK